MRAQRLGNAAVVALAAILVLGGIAACYFVFTGPSEPPTPAPAPVQPPALSAPTGAKLVVNSLRMRFAPIPAGKFLMGSPRTEAQRGDDEDQHEVVLTKNFLMGVHEVTQAQFKSVMGVNPSFFVPGQARVRGSDTGASPVECVTWHQAVEFARKLGELPDEKKAGRTYRLPTEAEWEYACRAGTTTALHYGDNVGSYAANFNGLSPFGAGMPGPFHRTTVQVGNYAANQFGLFDMHGNVMEWCQDWYAADAYAKNATDPTGPATGTEKVTRGGSWSNSGKACRSAVRTKLAPDESHYGLGFRLVLVQ